MAGFEHLRRTGLTEKGRILLRPGNDRCRSADAMIAYGAEERLQSLS
jgi:hypothetical protein